MGTNYIAPIWRMPKNANKDKLSNYSIEFDNANANYIQTNTSWITDLGLNGANKLSVSIWLKPSSSAPTTAMSATSSPYNSWNENFNIKYDAGNTSLYFTGGSSASTKFFNNSVTLTTDQWHHVVFVFDSSAGSTAAARTRCWINNSEVANQATNLWVSISDLGFALYIGRLFYGAGGSANQWVGEISQFCIFDYALSTNQINYLYNLNNPMAISGAEPVAYWPLGDNSNANATAGYPNVSVGADSVFDFENSVAPVDYVEIPSFDELKPDRTLTISAWVKRESNNIQHPIFDQGQRSGVLLWLNQASNPSTLGFYVQNGSPGDGSPNWIQYVSTATVPKGEWTHVCVTLDKNAGNLRFYVNGNPPASNIGVPVGNIGWSATNSFTIGSHRGVYFMDGEMSNVQLWDTVLSDSEVETLYNNGKPLMTGTQPQASNLKAWYKLDQSANWEADTTGNWQIPDAVSSYPQSFDFGDANAGGEYIDAPTNIGGFTKCSTSVWLNPSSVSAKSTIFATNTANNFNAYFWTGNIIYVTVDGAYGYLAAINNYIDANKWNHLSIVYDGTFTDPDAATQNAGRLKMYVNGSYIAFQAMSGTIPSSIPVSGSDNIRIGTTSPTTYEFGGELSNFTIYDTNLSASQVETLYNNGSPLTTAIATDNLKAWYKLDNTELFDGTNWSVDNQKYPASYESALKFPGNFATGTGINFSPLTINATQANTYSAWVYPIGHTAYWTMLMGDYSGSTSKIAPISLVNSGGSNWAIRSTQRSINTAANSVKSNNISNNELGKWHHIMVVVDNLDVSFYLNGQPHGTATFTNPWTSSTFNLFNIGNFSNWVANGYMSNIAIWNSDQSTNIANIYNNGTPQNSYTVEPIALWKLDNTTTGLNDIIGGKNGTLTGDITKVNTFVSTEAGKSSALTEQSLANNNVSVLNGDSVGMDTTNLVTSNISRTQPFSNYSFNFDAGVSDYIEVNNPGSIFAYGESAFTFSGWISVDAYSDQDGIFSRFQDTNNRATIKLTFNSPFNGLMFQTVKSGTNSYIRWNGTLPSTANGEWKHICLTYDAANVKLYVDGVDQGAGTITGTMPTTMPNLSAATPIDIAVDKQVGVPTRCFNGRASNFCVFDRALTESEILKIYNNGVTQDLQATSSFSNNILGWWPMDQRSSYYDGTDWVVRDLEGGKDGNGVNTGNVDDMVGSAPGSEASGTGTNLNIADLKGNMYSSDKNAYSINMGDYADGVTNPANSGRSTDTP